MSVHKPMSFSSKLVWDSVEVGSEIPPIHKVATTQMLVKWAGASGDFNPLHYDAAFVRSLGPAGPGTPVVHGALKRQWLIQMMTDWVGESGWLRKFSCRYRAMDYPRAMETVAEPQAGETWMCKGKVTKKYTQEGQRWLDCEIWVENGKGETTTSGKATVVLF
jgi:acyl dehydratase